MSKEKLEEIRNSVYSTVFRIFAFPLAATLFADFYIMCITTLPFLMYLYGDEI